MVFPRNPFLAPRPYVPDSGRRASRLLTLVHLSFPRPSFFLSPKGFFVVIPENISICTGFLPLPEAHFFSKFLPGASTDAFLVLRESLATPPSSFIPFLSPACVLRVASPWAFASRCFSPCIYRFIRGRLCFLPSFRCLPSLVVLSISPSQLFFSKVSPSLASRGISVLSSCL